MKSVFLVAKISSEEKGQVFLTLERKLSLLHMRIGLGPVHGTPWAPASAARRRPCPLPTSGPPDEELRLPAQVPPGRWSPSSGQCHGGRVSHPQQVKGRWSQALSGRECPHDFFTISRAASLRTRSLPSSAARTADAQGSPRPQGSLQRPLWPCSCLCH